MKHFVIAVINTEHDDHHPTIEFVRAISEKGAVREVLADYHRSMYGPDAPVMEKEPYPDAEAGVPETWGWNTAEGWMLYAATIAELPYSIEWTVAS